MIRSSSSLFAVLLIQASCVNTTVIDSMSLREIDAQPNELDGKTIKVNGYLNFGREGDMLCETREYSEDGACAEMARSGLFNKMRSKYYHQFEKKRVSFLAKVVFSPKREPLECEKEDTCIVLFAVPYRFELASPIKGVQ